MIEMHSWASHEAPLLAKKNTASLSRSTVYAGIVMLGVVALVAMAFMREDINNIFPKTQENIAQTSMCQHLDKQGYGSKAQADCIDHLPRLTFKPNFKSFSGYLPISTDKEMFYWFVESQGDPDKDALMFWMNGGPGCSGLGGLLSEHGPYWVYSDMSLRPNKHSLNKIANVVYFEGPIGVGFSTPKKGHDVVLGDIPAAKDNAAMIRAFLDKYPKYRNHDVYITSESYGGHYMPTLAVELLLGNEKKLKPHVNFKGMAVGNPFVNWWSNRRGSMNADFGHNLMKLPLVNDWNKNCDKDLTQVDMKYCNKLYVDISKRLGHLDPYALDFTYCPTDSLENGNQNVHAEHRRQEKKMIHEAMANILHVEKKLNYVACADNYMAKYLNKPDVQQALHAKKVKWNMCSDAVFKHWPTESWAFPMEKIYKKLAAADAIKIMVYSGDDDSVCSTYSSQLWLWRMGFPVDKERDWKPWYIDDQLSGYHTRFLSHNDKKRTSLDFVTIRTAGHMVPATQPQRALLVYRQFLQSDPKEAMQFGERHGFW